MNFSIPATMRRLIAPRHRLSFPPRLWERLLRQLRERGRNETRESGAFLVGTRLRDRARVLDFVLYDDLDPHCLDSGIVRFDGRYFDELWDLCRQRDLAVVADVHVHPSGAGQSESDRAHPMISRAGHIAIIVPSFARKPVHRRDLGIYEYRGGKQWHVVAARERERFLHIGI